MFRSLRVGGRVLLGLVAAATGTACIEHSLAAGTALQPQPRQSILVLEADGAVVGGAVTVRARLLRGSDVEPVGAYTVRLLFDTAHLVLAPTTSSGIDTKAFGERAIMTATSPAEVGQLPGAPAPLQSSRLAVTKSYPARTALRRGQDSASLHVVHVREAQRLQRVAPTSTGVSARAAFASPSAVIVPEGMRAMHMIRPGELRIATVAPDGLGGDVLFEVEFRARSMEALTSMRVNLDELVGVRFDDQRPFTRVEPRVLRQVSP